ncbi:MAG: hypothetical protein ACO3UU_08915, partial [Minisyncoccia bacterium]
MYAFFAGRNVTSLCFPKLLEITMTSGTFIVGETVNIMKPGSTTKQGSFRVAALNHKGGNFRSPSQFYIKNPYSP